MSSPLPDAAQRADSEEIHYDGRLFPEEIMWRDHYEYLKSCGYQMRDRYKPDWVPSWQGKGLDQFAWRRMDDGIPIPGIADAIRTRDGAAIAFKYFVQKYHPYEAEVALKFSSPPFAQDPRNHCVPVHEVLDMIYEPGWRLIVTPLLRAYDDPPWQTIGEVIAMWQQLFEGLHFMHINHTAHRDCTNNNIMLDPASMYPEGFHPVMTRQRRDLGVEPKHFTRSQRPPRYYLIDFGLSQTYPPEQGPPRDLPVHGGDKSMPEFQDHPDEPYDPFSADVYYMGNWVKEHFMKKYYGFDFMAELVADMTQRDPARRPTMEQVVEQSGKVFESLSAWKLRSRVARRKENAIAGVFRSVGHLKTRLSYARASLPLIPLPTGDAD